MFKLIIATILNTFTLTSQCDINNTINKEELNNTIQLPKSTFRIVNDCNKQRDFYYRESYNNDKLFILDQFKWKDFNYINDFAKNNGVVFRYGKQLDATLFEANYDTFPIGNSKDGIFDLELFQTYYNYYVNGYLNIFLRISKTIKYVFYPSTTAIDENVYPEYSQCKLIGEHVINSQKKQKTNDLMLVLNFKSSETRI